jgi:dTDP-glucose pyrophosphorylase
MQPFSDHYPKPVLPVGNRPLIEHQVETMKRLGIEDVVVLVGHKGFEISKALGDGSRFGVKIRYVEQTTALGIAHAVGRLEQHIRTPFLLFLGDIFFVPGPLESLFELFEEQDGGAVLATKEEQDERAIQRNYALVLNADGMVTRVIEKPRHVRNRLKGVGLYLFDLTIFDAIRRTPRTAMRDEYEITDAIQILIDDGYPVRPCSAVLDDINLTTPADLLYCNLLQAKANGGSLVGEGVEIAEGANVSRCVIGDHAVVQNPIELSETLVFPGTHVQLATGVKRFILTPELSVDCSQGITQEQLGRWM